jgi:hypothetical protein
MLHTCLKGTLVFHRVERIDLRAGGLILLSAAVYCQPFNSFSLGPSQYLTVSGGLPLAIAAFICCHFTLPGPSPGQYTGHRPRSASTIAHREE